MTLIQEPESPFLHGVASGDPRADRVLIWTRVTTGQQEPTAVLWEMAADRDFRQVVARGEALTNRNRDFTINVDVVGMQPATLYFYRFEWQGARSPVGRTKTLPLPGVACIRFAQLCCAKLNVGYFNAYGRVADRLDLDFFLHLGDYIYETSEHGDGWRLSHRDAARAYDPPHECKTLDDYRRRYARYRLDPDLQRLHQALPMMATIDDHEIADGAWRDGSEDHDEQRDGAWAERRRIALKARAEWLPLRTPDSDAPERVYSAIEVGDLLKLILIDTRTQRDRPQECVAAPERTALGGRQLGWLLGELDSSRAAWRVIGSPTVMAALAGAKLPGFCEDALRTLRMINPRSGGPDLDPWAGYPHERESLLRSLRDAALDNVVFLSGDVHVSLASELSCECGAESAERVAVEFVTPSVTSQNLDDKMGWEPRTRSPAVEQALREGLPAVRWCELDSHGYVVVDITRDIVRAEWWFVDALDARSTGETRGAAWMVKRGLSRLIAVPP